MADISHIIVKLSLSEVRAVHFALGKQSFADYPTPELASAGHGVYDALPRYIIIDGDDDG